MTINWGALGLVSVVALFATVVVVGIVSLGLASLSAADARVAEGRPGGSGKTVGYACLVMAALVVVYGLYLIIPQFH